VTAVIFDIDGTLLDSATGIVAGFQHALRSVGFEPPDEQTLRSDLGPPVGLLFAGLGLPQDRIADAVAAYRTFYFAEGLQQASAYAGIIDLLDSLAPVVPLGTATAKRTDVAEAIMAEHGLADYFRVINGTDQRRTTKAETIAQTLADLGDPSPADVVMVGDRHSDITGGRSCGLRTVGVTWGYGSRAELVAAAPDVLVDSPAELAALLPCS
jgi:phosphoglycolate phosphatase